MKRFKYLTLAALVAFAACDEGEETVTPPPVTGTISGVVTIEGVGASGITVTLSSGATATTDASGAYSFSGVEAGAYTVTISGFPSDVSFTATVKAVTISTAGQVATANFDGSYIRTSAILGSVSGGGTGLAGVTVTLSGTSSASTTTDANGTYSFSGLRAGTYTVSISGFDASQYTFPATSQNVTLGVGQSQVVSFSGSLVMTAKISGSLFIDEFSKDDILNSGLEENLKVAGVAITLEGGSVNDTMTVLTDANGDYMFENLAAGTYRLTINTAGVPGMVTFGGTNPQLVTVSTGATATVNWPFDITTQTIKVYGYLGIDGTNPGVTPLQGWTINLYDTQANAAAGGATGRLGQVATDASGESVFRFSRSNDVSPNSSVTDNVVFAQVAGPPAGAYSMSGETIIEIKYNPSDSIGMAPDTFDALYNQLVVKVHAAEIDNDTLANWNAVLRVNKDSTFATTVTDATDANGDAFWTLTPTAFPDTIWVRLSTTQANAGGHGFTMAPVADEGTAMGRYLRFIWDGTVAPSDTIELGTEQVTYTDSDLTFRVHREQDDSTSVPTYTLGDNLASVTAINVTLKKASDGSTVAGPTAAGAGTGLVTFTNVPTGVAYQVVAQSTDANLKVLNDTLIALTPDGSDQTYTDATLAGGAGNSSFAIKSTNNTISGNVLADDGTAAANVIVTLTATADNIQGSATMVDTTSAAGAYSFTNVIEGPYTISVADIAGTWEFFDTLTTTSAPNNSGSANNDDARTATRDLQGYGVTQTANFQPDAMNTKIEGVVVNDRDSDFNTLDPDEALSGVVINLYDDADGDGAIDTGESIVAVDTTDANGAYSFSGLREGKYIVEAVSPANATVLRALSATGAVTNWIGVTTEAGTGNCALANCTNQDNTNNVGNTSPPAQNDEFPRWNYLTGAAAADGGNLGGGAGPNATNGALTTTPTHFVHLFNTGTVTGKVTAGGSAVAGVRVTITRCQTAATAPSPPAAGACTAKHGTPSPHIINQDTDSNGNYTFTGLLEGVYQIDVAPATAGYTNIVTPAGGTYLATLQGNNDVETVPDFVIS